MAARHNPSVRGKFVAYLIQEAPACCHGAHGLTAWCDSEDDLREHIEENFPGAFLPAKDVPEAFDAVSGLASNPATGQADTVSGGSEVKESHDAVPGEGSGSEEEGEEDEDFEEDLDTSVVWSGTFEKLCEDQAYQAQVVRVRFFSDFNHDHPDQKVEFSYSDSDPTPSVPEALRDAFDEWLASGEQAFC
jgi:hypothetical protein